MPPILSIDSPFLDSRQGPCHSLFNPSILQYLVRFNRFSVPESIQENMGPEYFSFHDGKVREWINWVL